MQRRVSPRVLLMPLIARHHKGNLDHTPARLALAEAAVQAATRLRPDAAETHLARAQYLYYWLRGYAGECT
jgi:hypothetical protein